LNRALQICISLFTLMVGALRLVLAAFAQFALLHPREKLATLACVPVLLFIGFWIMRRRTIASRQESAAGEPALASSYAGSNSTGAGS
jgi:hypothetical protein